MANEWWTGQPVPDDNTVNFGYITPESPPLSNAYGTPGWTAPASDMNQAGAGSDPFAYTMGSLLTPWTRSFNYPSTTPAGGYYSGSGGYSPLAPFQFGDFNYGFSQPGAFTAPEAFKAPAAPFTYASFQAPAAFTDPNGQAYVAPRYDAPDAFGNYQGPGEFKAPGIENGEWQQDPGYKFRLQQGLESLQASAAAKGVLRGGNTWTALENYGQDAASQEYQAAYNRALQAWQANATQSLAGYDRNLAAYQTNANLGLAEFDRNAAAGLTENELRYNRAASEYDRSYQNALQRYQMGYSQASSEYDRNFNNAFNVYQANFANAYNAWKGNADVSLQGQGLGYNIASGAWDRNYGKALTSYQQQVQQAEMAAQIAASEAAAAAGSAQWADQTNYNRALQGYNMDYEAFNNNQTNQFNRLYAVAGMGQNAANALSGAASNYGTNAGNLALQYGNAGAAGTVGSANAWNTGLGSIGNALAQYALLGGGYQFPAQKTTLTSGQPTK